MGDWRDSKIWKRVDVFILVVTILVVFGASIWLGIPIWISMIGLTGVLLGAHEFLEKKSSDETMTRLLKAAKRDKPAKYWTFIGALSFFFLYLILHLTVL